MGIYDDFGYADQDLTAIVAGSGSVLASGQFVNASGTLIATASGGAMIGGYCLMCDANLVPKLVPMTELQKLRGTA